MTRFVARTALATAFIAAGCASPTQNATPTASPATEATPATVAAEPGATPKTMADEPASIPFEELARFPRPGMSMPVSFSFSPDDTTILYLDSAENSLVRELYAFDLASGESRRVAEPADGGDSEENLTAAEKLRRERQRSRGLGIRKYAWAAKADVIMVPLKGDVFVKQGIGGELRRAIDVEGGTALSARISRDGTKVGFVHDDEVYVGDVASGKYQQITRGARGTGKTHGLAEYVAQEEMGRFYGFWWSRDGKKIAYTQVDETHIPEYRIVHQGSDEVFGDAQEDHRYPFAGTANAKIRLGVVNSRGGKTTWLDLGDDDDIYLARVNWMPDGSLLAQVQNRAQTQLDLIRFDTRTGKGTRVLREQTEVWINLHRLLKPLTEGAHAGGFVWGSERSGFAHLYLYGKDGKLVRPLTSGEWMVDSIEGIDQKNGVVYFTGTKDGPTERHLYSVSLEGGDVRKITTAPGKHNVTLDHGFTHFVDTFQSLESPPTVSVRKLADGSPVHTIYAQRDPRIDQLGLQAPELVTLESRDGVQLHGAIYRPPATFKAPYPTVVSVYGGPHAQMVENEWAMTSDLRAQSLARQGFLVFKLDNRGSARRGLAFEGAIKNDMGNLELRDQVDGVQWLVSQGLTDADRVGIFGWSYGGYMTAMALARAPETFKVGVAGAPVTHWDGYDTHYTERYMSTPASNPKGYEESSVMHHVDKMTGKLLLIHGLIDENVHFRHTARLINALNEKRKDYELLLFPDARHGPRKESDRVFLEERISQFFKDHL